MHHPYGADYSFHPKARRTILTYSREELLALAQPVPGRPSAAHDIDKLASSLRSFPEISRQ